jgi:uncharacterized protein (TIGR00255 family)
MIESMTCFGSATVERDGLSATVELRSVNNRFLEVSVRLPRHLAFKEQEATALVRQVVQRGKVSVSVQIGKEASAEIPIHVDADVARSYVALLQDLRQATGITDPVRLEHLLQFSDIFTTDEAPADHADQTWSVAREALEHAIANLQQMRRQEGEALRVDLIERLSEIERRLVEVEARAPERVREQRDRLKERVAELIGEERVNPERLELEIALLAERLDVTEETVRLRSHIAQFREALDGAESAGRKLNFLIQEVNREVNTIGSKANDATLAHLAVQMKEELERVREQIQNLE